MPLSAVLVFLLKELATSFLVSRLLLALLFQPGLAFLFSSLLGQSTSLFVLFLLPQPLFFLLSLTLALFRLKHHSAHLEFLLIPLGLKSACLLQLASVELGQLGCSRHLLLLFLAG